MLRANICWKSVISFLRGPVDPIFQVEGVTPTNHSSSQKTRLNGLSYDIKICSYLSSILSQIPRLTDGQTDKQTEFSPLDRVCIPCNAVIIKSEVLYEAPPSQETPKQFWAVVNVVDTSDVDQIALQLSLESIGPTTWSHVGDGPLLQLKSCLSSAQNA